VIVGGLVAIIAGTIAILLAYQAMIGFGWTSAGTSNAQPNKPPQQPATIETIGTLRQYVLSSPHWLTTPTTFTARLKITLERQATTGHSAAVRLNPGGTDVEADSVEDIAQNGSEITGVVIVVGRVQEESASPVIWAPGGHARVGPDHNVVLESPSRRVRIFGLISGQPRRGEVVYFPGVVVAVGYTSNGVATAYVISLSAAVTTRLTTSGAIKVLIKAYPLHGAQRRPRR